MVNSTIERRSAITPRQRQVVALIAAGCSNDEVGARLGFDIPAHFTRFFRNHTGVSPSEFRAVSRLAN